MRTFSLVFFAGTLLINGFMVLPDRSSWLLAAALLAIVLLGFVYYLPGKYPVILWGALAGFSGFLYAGWQAQQVLDSRLAHPLIKQDLLVTGVIRGLPAADEQSRRFIFDVESASLAAGRSAKQLSTEPLPVSGKIRLGWYRHFPEKLDSGTRWQLLIRAKPPDGSMNPGGFDYEKWLFTQRIIATGYVRKSALNKPLANTWRGSVDRLRQQVVAAIHRMRDNSLQSPDSPVNISDASAILAALAVAYRGDISTEQWQTLRRTGTSHLVAISGLHIGLVAGFGFLPVFMVWWLWPGLYLRLPVRLAAAISGAAGAALYALMAGMTLPTQRALTMVLVIMGGLLLRRSVPFTTTLCCALLAVLLLDPLASLSAGFWLSFAAVLMIFLITRRQLRQHSRWQVIIVQLGLSLGMLPLTAGFFGSTSLISPLANLLAIPWVSLVVVPLVLLGMLLLLMSEALAFMAWSLALQAIHWLLWVLDWLATLEGAALSLPEMPWWWLLFALAGFLLLILPRGVPGRWLGLLLALPLFVWQPERPAPGEFRLTVLDVGQGLANVIQTHQHTLLYDTGPRPSESFDAGERVVLPWLTAHGIDRLEGLLISHADNDHSGGALSILTALPVARLLSNDRDTALIGQQQAEDCVAGKQWTWDGVNFEILHPTEAFISKKRNDGSCVLRVSNAAHSVLLSGDIERPAEYWLSKRLREQLRSEVFIVPHHGSRTSSSPALLKRVDPQLAIVSAGYLSRFNHPHPKVSQRYSDWGIPLLNTADSGAITVSFPADEQPFETEQYRLSERRFWNR